ncbi:Helitron helicase [Phytophthora megakarya]|uniref:Helitron helicase n=1 Tax=Phytophthora megakarya TaxID=4795 RepID=A0A225VP26_9STRA|nr:Helitron helicase [Phytophthora megakarya]
MNRGFFKAVVRVVRDIKKNDSELSGGKVITTDKFYLYLKDATRAETIAAYFERSAADLAKFSEFILQIGEGRYPVNEDIGEGDICLPHDMYVFPEPLEMPPVLGEPREEDADNDSDGDEDDDDDEDDETESFPYYNLHPSVDDHNSRDLEFMVHDAAPDSDNVSPEADDADDDRRARNVNALIDAVYPGINADEMSNEYFVERTTTKNIVYREIFDHEVA